MLLRGSEGQWKSHTGASSSQIVIIKGVERRGETRGDIKQKKEGTGTNRGGDSDFFFKKKKEGDAIIRSSSAGLSVSDSVVFDFTAPVLGQSGCFSTLPEAGTHCCPHVGLASRP